MPRVVTTLAQSITILAGPRPSTAGEPIAAHSNLITEMGQHGGRSALLDGGAADEVQLARCQTTMSVGRAPRHNSDPGRGDRYALVTTPWWRTPHQTDQP